jgi:hypothetical protein
MLGADRPMACKTCQGKADITDLSAPYVIRVCRKCGRKIKVREPGDRGLSISIKKGDQIVIPDGWLQVSANPL